jgi:hypothetical protein
MTDKAARAALLTAKGMDKTSENIADYVADLLRQGRAKEITDDLIEQADPQRLMHHYKTGNTGMDLPMDQASRMARAKEMGFLSGEYHGTTTGGDMRYPNPNYGSGTRKNIGFVTSSNPYVASTYADPNFGSVFPMLNRDPNLAKLNAEGRAWSDIPEETEVTLPSGGKTDVGRYASGPADMGGVHDTNQIARGAHIEGHGGVRVANVLDRSIHLPDDPENSSLRQEFQKKSSVPSDVTFRQDTRGMRSQFARFDPRLDHLAHLNASAGGAMDFARHVEAVTRAGGQIAPSKYLPNVPRAVHAGGGKVAYHATQEPFENYDWGRLGQTTKDNTSGTSVDDWASSLANLGPWSHEKPISKQLGMKTDLPVMLTGKEKKFKSLDHLSQEISRHGGPAALRGKLVSQGYGHVSVDDEEFGGKSYVGLSPDHFKITKAGGGDVEGDDDGITAYHSSPHDFDQFDVSKLGTGEGNQSYGPGLYFAENPKVSDRGGQYWNQFMNRGKMTPEKKAAFALQMAGWDRDKAADRLQKRMEDHIDRAIPGKYGNGPVDEEGNRLLAQETQEAIDHVRSGKILGPRTYKVKLNVKPHELIDWDEPMSEQHPNIQAVLGSSHETAGSKLSRVNRNPYYRGDILGKDTATLQELYDHFRSKGIKGIRYNDAGSRHGSNGDGTKNYVMFHHDPVQIVDKYEYGGTVGKEEGGATGSLREKGLWPSAQAIKAGTGSREAHAEMVNKIKPVSPYDAPVPPASDEQVHDALTKDKQPKAFAPRGLKEGTPVAVRLDIPAYEKRNTWVVSVHHPKSDFTAGEVIGYDSVAHIGNPRFGVHPTGALNIASGKPKATIATVHGNWKKTTPEDAFKLSQTIHNDPQWRQVGMDPERHSYFYDRETQEPVMAADEALHIGPLVYAKNPVYGKKTDFAFSSGGDVSAAIALTRRFTKDGAGATMALKPKGK